MHPIVNQYVKEVVANFNLEDETESKQFEYFCNYLVVSKHYLGRFNPVDVTTQEDDASIDGIAFIIDGEIISTVDDAEQAFKTHKMNLPVDVIITQVKSGENFKKQEMTNFGIGVKDFLSLDPELPNGEFNLNAIEIFQVIINNVTKIKNSQPDLYLYYCTSGNYNEEAELKATLEIIRKIGLDSDLFNSVKIDTFCRKKIIKNWTSLNEKNEAKLQLIDYIGIKETQEIKESYIAIVNAKSFLEAIVIDEDGNLKEAIFDENVRGYLGEDNAVNSHIDKTLNSKKSHLFPILNNGVTIIADDITVQSNTKTIYLTNYQIINGCQTSNVLYKNIATLDQNVELVVKFIELSESKVSSDIVMATNNQTKIDNHKFVALNEKAKLIQKFFDIKNAENENEKIYFERRENEYRKERYQTTRIFDVQELARCYVSCFKQRPHNAYRYIKKTLEANNSDLFQQEDKEAAYYLSALICYRYNVMINSKKFNAKKYNKLRWHIMMLYIAVIKADKNIRVTKNLDPLYVALENSLSSDNCVKYFEHCQNIIDRIKVPSTDAIKRGRYTQELLAEATKYFKSKAFTQRAEN